MTADEDRRSIFGGTNDIISTFLGLAPGEKLGQKSVYRRLSDTPQEGLDFDQLLGDLYGQIELNRTLRAPSKENWRSSSQTTLAPQNTSPEVLLERAIAILGEREILKGWYNQVPVASGLVNSRADRRAAVDLVKHSNDQATLVELKWESDTPAFAAFEILLYGLAYLYCYTHRQALGYEAAALMQLKRVSLRVLAPVAYYDNGDLSWLGRGFNHAIQNLAQQLSNGELTLDFGFLAFPVNFDLPFETGSQVLKLKELPTADKHCQILIAAMSNLDNVWV